MVQKFKNTGPLNHYFSLSPWDTSCTYSALAQIHTQVQQVHPCPSGWSLLYFLYVKWCVKMIPGDQKHQSVCVCLYVCVWVLFLKISSTKTNPPNLTQFCTFSHSYAHVRQSQTEAREWISGYEFLSWLTHLLSVTPTLLPHSQNSRGRINKFLEMYCSQNCLRNRER